MLILNSWNVPFLIIPVHSLNRVKNYKLFEWLLVIRMVVGYWAIGGSDVN